MWSSRGASGAVPGVPACLGSVPRWAFPRSVFCPRPCPPLVVPCAAARGFPPPLGRRARGCARRSAPRSSPAWGPGAFWALGSPRCGCRSLPRDGRAHGAPAARGRGRMAFSRVRLIVDAHPTRQARRGTRRASEPGRGSNIPREGERPRRGTLAALLRPAPCASSLRYQNLKALPQIGQYRQYSRTGYPQK